MEQYLNELTQVKIRNYYYLIAGILALFFSVTHALNGQTSVIPTIDNLPAPVETKVVFNYVWHIITIENLVFGITFIYMAFQNNASRFRFAARMVAILMIFRWIVIFSGTLSQNPTGLKNISLDTMAIAIYVSLLLLGTTVKDRNERLRNPVTTR